MPKFESFNISLRRMRYNIVINYYRCKLNVKMLMRSQNRKKKTIISNWKLKKKSWMNKSFGFFLRDVDIQAICYELIYAPMFTQECIKRNYNQKKNVVVRTEHLIWEAWYFACFNWYEIYIWNIRPVQNEWNNSALERCIAKTL